MNFTQKSRRGLHARVVNGQWTPHITADQLGSISAQYQTDSSAGNGSAGQPVVSSNSWALTLRDAGEASRVFLGDQHAPVAVQVSSNGSTSEYYDWNAAHTYDAQGNLIGGQAQADFQDVIQGTSGNDKISGLGGNDALGGGAGNDKIEGGTGNDLIGGGAGADHILGGEGDDYIISSADIVASRRNSPTDSWTPSGPVLNQAATWGVYGTSEGYTIEGISATRTDTAASEGDVIDAGAGNDVVIASWADDRIQGGSGNDQIYGLAGNDIIEGGDGDDLISADGIVVSGDRAAWLLQSTEAAYHGNDFVDGGDGADTIEGGGGADQLFGGDGDEVRAPITTKFIAKYQENTPGNCQKSSKNRRETGQIARNSREIRKIGKKSATARHRSCVVCYGKRSNTNPQAAQHRTQAHAGDAA
jgi:Ca2+-binding RTX toxin-like protein